MTFACVSAYVVSYYCTMKSLPSPGWRKLFPSSFMDGSSGISEAELTPLSHSLIPHTTFMLARPWIRVGVSLLHKDTQEQGREPKCCQQSGWTHLDQATQCSLQMWAHALVWPVGTLQVETAIVRTSVFFPMVTRLWKIAEKIAQWAPSFHRNKHSTINLTDDLRKAHQATKMVMQHSLWRTVSAYPYWNASFSRIFLHEIVYCSVSSLAYLT